MGRRLDAVAAILLAGFVLAVSTQWLYQHRGLMGDFRAFYCAGSAVLHRETPYNAPVIAACEAKKPPIKQLFTESAGGVLPAPVPGYVAAAFAPFALLPLLAASALYFVLSLISIAAACMLLARAGVAPAATLVAAISILCGEQILPVGELPSFAFLGLACLVFAVGRADGRFAVLGTALIMVEPQAGVAALVVLLAQRRFIFEVLGTGAALLLVSLAAVGFSANVAYINTVLPEHVLSELPSLHQYTLTWAMSMLGVPATTAVGVARVTYTLALIAAAALAKTPIARSRTDLAVMTAPVIALTFSPFLHLDHVVLAVPAALALGKLTAKKWFATASAVSISVPVVRILVHPILIAAALSISAAIAYRYFRNGRAAAISALGTLAYVALCCATIMHSGLHIASPAIPASLHPTQAAWATYVYATFTATAWPVWILKAPLWLGLLGITCLYATLCLSERSSSIGLNTQAI